MQKTVCPEIIKETSFGEYEVSCNDWGELRIHNIYSKETWRFDYDGIKNLVEFLAEGEP